MKIGSLFSGIGGLELGLEQAGVGKVVWQAECDPYASAVLAKRWPSVKRYADVKEINEQTERVDLICGGFPCQDISNAGKRAGIDGAKSGLWSEYARILRLLRPRYVFIENVAALVNRGLGRVLGDLSALGFDAEWTIVSAADAGAPHLRERVFILAYANGDGLREKQEQLSGSRASSVSNLYGTPRFMANSHGNCESAIAVDAKASELRSYAGPFANWPTEPDVGRVADGIPSRVDRLRCLGNAVVPAQAALAWKTLAERAAQ